MVRTPVLWPLVLLAACGAPPDAPAQEPKREERLFLESSEALPDHLAYGKTFTFNLWTPQRPDLVPGEPLPISWVACNLHIGVDGSLKKHSCAPSKPWPEKLDSVTRSGLERCYRIKHERGSNQALKAVERQFGPNAQEETIAGAVTAVINTIDTDEEVAVYGPGGAFEPVPDCPKEHPGCDYRMVPRKRRASIGTKVETRRREDGPFLSGPQFLPVPYPAVTFSVAIPEGGPESARIRDRRFEVTTEGREARDVADELSSKLDAIAPEGEPAVVREAYWLNRALLAMIRRDAKLFASAYAGLEEISKGGQARSSARATLYTMGQIRGRNLVFDDPCETEKRSGSALGSETRSP